MNLKIYIALFVGVVSISFAAILIRLASDVPSVVITAYRLSISSLLLIAFWFLKGRRTIRISPGELAISALSGLFLSAHFMLWVTSIKFTSIPSSVTLVCTSPIFVGIFSAVVLKEKQNRMMVLAIALSVIGSAILASADGGLFTSQFDRRAFLGDLLALMGAIAITGYFLAGSYLRRNMDTLSYVVLIYTFSAIFSLIFAVITHQKFFGYPANAYLYMFLLAVVPQILGHTSFNWALKYTKTSAVSISTLGEPVGSTILAYIFFHTVITPVQTLGMVIILFAIFIAVTRASSG